MAILKDTTINGTLNKLIIPANRDNETIATLNDISNSIATHSHSYITGFGSYQTINSTTYTTDRITVRPYYSSGGPTTYGNIIEVVSSTLGGGRLAMEWSGSQTAADGSDSSVGHLYYSSKRDCINGWTKWNTIIDSANISSQSVNYANSSNYASSAASATNATYATKFGSASSNVSYDLSTNNTVNTNVPVLNNGKMQYRVIPVEYNNSFTTNLKSCFSYDATTGTLTISI